MTAPEAVPLSRLALLDTVLSRGDPRESLELLRRMTPISPTDLGWRFQEPIGGYPVADEPSPEHADV